MEATRFLTVHYLDGTSETFSFAKQAVDQFDMMNRLHTAMTSDRIVIEANERLHIIPVTSIKRVEFSPLPEKLPQGIIKGANLHDSFHST